VGLGGVARHSNFNDLKLQTCVSARIEPKGYFGALTNPEAVTPPARDMAGSHIGPSTSSELGAAP
jgi:hypothetical protein